MNKIQSDADKARAAGAEFIICLPHWGVEYKVVESENQRKQANWIFENTEVDMIVGAHPHVVQPADYIKVTQKDNKEKTGFILYSLGNFIANHASDVEYADTGIILNITLSKNIKDGTVELKDVRYIPIVVDRTRGNKLDSIVRGLEDAIRLYESKTGTFETITQSEYNKFLEYREHYKNLLGDVIYEKIPVSDV